MPLSTQESISVGIAIVLVIAVIVFLYANVIGLTDVSNALAAVLLAALFGVIVWGFKPRISSRITPAEESKKSKGHKITAESTEMKETGKIRNTIRLRVDEVEEYICELHKNDGIRGKVSADGVFSVYILTESSRRSFYNGNEFHELDGMEEGYSFECDFNAPRKGIYYVILSNEDRKNIKMDVDLRLTYSG